MKGIVVFLVIFVGLALGQSDNCEVRIMVAVPNSNFTFSVYDNTSSKELYQMRNLDITPYYNVTCNKNYQYSFSNPSGPIAKSFFKVGQFGSLILAGLVGGSGVSVVDLTDDWNVDEGTAIIRFVHLAPLTGPLVIQGNGTNSAKIAYQQASQYLTYPSNKQYAWYISNQQGQVVLDEFLFLNDQTSYTVWIQGLPNNLALVMTQDYPADVPSP